MTVSGTNFGAAASDYGKFRAGFPDSIFDRLAAFGIGAKPQTIVDLGTGTGTLARGFALRGCHVIGVDPDERMLSQARELDLQHSVSVTYVNAKTFDGIWMDWYLRRFAGQPLFPSLFDEDPPFFGDGLDLPTFIAGRLGVDYSACVRKAYPENWFGGVRHSHKALDDASGYASVLRHVLAYPKC